MNSRFWALLLALGTLTLVLTAWNPLPEPANIVGLTDAEQGIWVGINTERTKAGLGALKFDVRLSAAARGHAKDMADRNYFEHHSGRTGFDTPGDRIHQAGSFEQAWAENIAFEQGKPDSSIVATFVTGWMNSPGHFKNIMTPGFTHTGIGVFKSNDGRVYAVQEFSSREFETTFDNISGNVRFNDLELRGVNKSNLELAVFSGRDYLGTVPQDASGRFVMKLPFTANAKFDVGWREKGSSKNFLLAKYVQTSDVAKSGKLEVKNHPGTSPFSLEANVLVQTVFSQTLTIKFSGASKALLVIEKINGSEVRRAVKNNQIQLTCPALSAKRTVQLVHGTSISQEFIWNCATGRLEASFGN
jgi:Cysteine-rich secretory protein family